MNRKVQLSVLVLVAFAVVTFLTSCSSNSNSGSGSTTPAAIAATAGATQSATVGAAFGTALSATVTNSSGSPVSGVSVTFTAPSSGASGTFANGTATETDTTSSTGVATSSTFTANTTTGAYTVTAAVSGVTTPASFSLTNTAAVVTTTTYVFYASGTELPNAGNSMSESYYALAGAVTIDANGNVTAGEEDYNDGNGITQGGTTGALPITGGTLTVDSTTGQGTLTLVTNNGTNTQYVGVAGTETLGVQFANTNHALIIQFDGSATSSGSMDLQTATSGGGSFAFVLAGTDYNYAPVGYGGVYSVSSNAITGTADVNDDGVVTLGTTFTGTSGSPDSYGRGSASVTINGTALTLFYYNVGPEVSRLIDMDAGFTQSEGGSAVGSAYGQGTTTTFSASSLGSSVLGLQADPFGFPYATAGSITTNPAAGTFSGIVDDDEDNIPFAGQAISGTYTFSSTTNGYGNLTIPNTPLDNVSNLGIYMTDPTLNLLDPNNTAGPGGALVLDLDVNLSGGTGVIIPQTDMATTSFNGNYAFGAQEYFSSNSFIFEYDYLGQGSVASLALTGTGMVSDPFFFFGPNPEEYSNISMTGTITADPAEATNGRYTMSPFVVDAWPNSTYDNLSLAIYQANGGTLLFMDSSDSLGLGSFQQQGSLTGLPTDRHPVKKAQVKIKP